MISIPAHIPIAVLAEACGLSHKAARGLLKRAGILVLDGARGFAPRTAFRERLPDHFEDVHRWYRDRPRAAARMPGDSLGRPARP